MCIGMKIQRTQLCWQYLPSPNLRHVSTIPNQVRKFPEAQQMEMKIAFVGKYFHESAMVWFKQTLDSLIYWDAFIKQV